MVLAVLPSFAGDLAEFGGVAGGGDDGFAVSADDEGAAVEGVGAFGDGGVVVAGACGVFFGGDAFAGQRRFVHGEAGGVYQAAVGGDAVAGRQQQDVSGDDVALVEPDGFASPDGADDDVVADAREGFEGARAFAFHEDADGNRQDDGDEDAGAFEQVGFAAGEAFVDVDGQGDHPGDDEHDDHGFCHGVAYPVQQGFRLAACQGVGAVSLTVFLYLLRGQAGVCVGLEPVE